MQDNDKSGSRSQWTWDFLLYMFGKSIYMLSPQLTAVTSQQCFDFATRNFSKSGFSEKGHGVGDSFYEVYV